MSEAKAATHYQQGLDAKGARELKRAAHEFRRAIELDVRHAEAYRDLGWVMYGLGGDIEEARASLESSIELKPSLSDSHMYLAIVLNRLAKKDDSEAHFRMALGLTDDPALVHSTYAEEFLWHNSRYGDAEHHFRLALEHDPDLVLALRDYARMLTCHGRYDEAKRYFDRALEIDPDDRFTTRAYDDFLRELVADDRNQDECLRAAIAKDPNYTEGIQCLKDRGDR